MNIKEIKDFEEMLDALEDKADDILTWCRAKRDELEDIKAKKIKGHTVMRLEFNNVKSR